MAGRAGVVAAGTLLSRLLGLVRDQTLAGLFSLAQTDAFWVAFTLPNALRALLGEGVATSAAVPVLSEVRTRHGDEAARRFFARLRGVSLMVLLVVSALGVWGAPALVELFAGGLHRRGAAFEQTVVLTRWLFPYIFFMGTAALGMAALNTYGKFAAAAFAPGLLNVAFLVCAWTMRGWFAAHGWDPALTLAVGALLGGALQVLAQWPALRRLGFLDRPRFGWTDPHVRQVFARMAPMLAGMGVYAVDLMLSRRFLSEMPDGSQSYFSWAMRLCDFPQGIFILALQTATLPSLSKLAASGDRAELSKTYAYAMRLSLFVAIPATALMVVLAHPLVVALFQRGAFGPSAALHTARALMAQGLGIWTVAAVRQLLPVYYALGDTKTPVVVSALDLGAFVITAWCLRGPWGHVGVSAAVTISSAVQMALLWGGLARRLDTLRLAEIGASAARSLAGAVVGAAAAWLGATAVASRLGEHPGGAARLAPAALGTAMFAFAFLATMRWTGSRELDAVMKPLRRRLHR